MKQRDCTPTMAFLVPVSAKALRALKKRESGSFGDTEVVPGTGVYNALADYEPGPTHSHWVVEVVRKLSLDIKGSLYAVSFDFDFPRVTKCENGVVCSDDETDGADPRALVHALGLGGMLPPEPARPRSCMFIEDTSPADVARALGRKVPQAGDAFRLESRGTGVLGWSEEDPLGSLPVVISRGLGKRVYLAVDKPESFSVLVMGDGDQFGIFETPVTWSPKAYRRLDSVLGETTREGILRAMGAPCDPVEG